MDFEFDQRKSANNRQKHGIDFVEAQALWDDPRRIEIPARTEDEPRWLNIGKIGDKYWSAIITYRESKARLISIHRARETEVAFYESE